MPIKPKKTAQPSTLYYLADGEITDDDWNCDGVYLPKGTQESGLATTEGQELAEPLAIQIVPGTQLVAMVNPDTGAVEFNMNPAKVFKVGEGSLSIPTLSQADINAQVPNAPIQD